VSATFRPGTRADLRRAQETLVRTIDHFVERMGQGAPEPSTTVQQDALWERHRPTWEHLHDTADAFWVAETEGRVTGYARSIVRGSVRELTELFVLPEAQGAGIGRELLGRVFPAERGRNRIIVATTDPPALASYLRAGVTARFAIGSFGGAADAGAPVPDDVDFVRADTDQAGDAVIDALGFIDQTVIGHRRDEDHRWLLTQRVCHLLRRQERVIGYAYHGRWQGPIASLDPDATPALLSIVERETAREGHSTVSLDVPLVNSRAVTYLLARGYRLDPLGSLFLSDEPLGTFDRYVLTTPPLFL
jgi:GNAT superfamily N-acetyltransferase